MNVWYVRLFLIMSVVSLNVMNLIASDKASLIITQKESRQEIYRNSLVELFGLDKDIGHFELRDVTDVTISPRVVPNGWWVPQTRLDLDGKKYEEVKFTSKGDRIITFLKNVYACVWNAQDGKLLSRCDLSLCKSIRERPIEPLFNSFPKFKPDTNELLFVDHVGSLGCWNINDNVFRYITDPLGFVTSPVQWSKDKTKVIIIHDVGECYQASVLDTIKGCKEKILVRNIAFFDQVGFIKDSSKVIVFLKNINNYRDDECVEYKQLPFQELLNAEYYYYGKDNKLIARLIDIRIKEMIVNVLDVENNSVKKMRYPFKGISYSYPYTKDSIKSILEYYDRDSNNNLIYDSPFDNNGISMWYLESGQNTFAINSNVSLFSFKQFNNKKDLLLVRSPHEVSLWNIYSRKIIAEITNIKNLSDAQLSKQSNKLIVLADDYAHVWERNPLTFKQMLLRKLFNLYLIEQKTLAFQSRG